MIHEGTHGIHARTLLGRKVRGGRAAVLFEEMRRTASEAAAYSGELSAGGASSARDAAPCLDECARALQLAVTTAEHVTSALTSPQLDKGVALANAHEYLTLMGHTTVAWVWLRRWSRRPAAWSGSAGGADPQERDLLGQAAHVQLLLPARAAEDRPDGHAAPRRGCHGEGDEDGVVLIWLCGAMRKGGRCTLTSKASYIS